MNFIDRLAIIFIAVISGCPAPALGQVFSVKDTNGNSGYIFGSQHTQTDLFLPEYRNFEALIQSSKLVVMESGYYSILDMLKPLEGGAKLYDIAPDGLKDCTTDLIESVASKSPNPESAKRISNYAPGLLALLVSAKLIQDSFVQPGRGGGLESRIIGIAKSKSILIASLESPEQRREFISGINERDAWAIISKSCRLERDPAKFELIRAYIEEIRAAARVFDYDRFTIAHKEIYKFLGASEDFTREFWGVRNSRMSRKIMNLIARGYKPFVTIGVSHLGGDDGVLSNLRSAGLEVTPLPN